MILRLKEETERALKDGFSGLRATGEMTWCLEDKDALSQLICYECELHTQFGKQLTGLCQYDETRFCSAILSDIIRIHPKLFVRGELVQNRFCKHVKDVLSVEFEPVTVGAFITNESRSTKPGERLT